MAGISIHHDSPIHVLPEQSRKDVMIHARPMLVLLAFSALLCAADVEVNTLRDPMDLYRVAIDTTRSEYDRRLAIGMVHSSTSDSDKDTKAAALYFWGLAMLDGKTPERVNEHEGMDSLERAMEAGHAQAAADLAERAGAPADEKGKAHVLLLLATSFKLGNRRALDSLEKLLPTEMPGLKASGLTAAESWTITSAASNLDRPYWKLLYAYPVLIKGVGAGKTATADEVAHAKLVLDQAVARGDNDARYILATYLLTANGSDTRAQELLATAAQAGHQESVKLMAERKRQAETAATVAAAEASKPVQSPVAAPTSTGQPTASGEPSMASSIAAVLVLLGIILTIVVTILSLTGRMHVYMHMTDVGCSALTFVAAMIGLGFYHHREDIGSVWAICAFAVAALGAVLAFFYAMRANGGVVVATLTFIPKILFSAILIVLGVVSVGAAMAAAQTAKEAAGTKNREERREKYVLAAKQAGVAAGSGLAAGGMLWFISKLMPPGPDEADPTVADSAT